MKSKSEKLDENEQLFACCFSLSLSLARSLSIGFWKRNEKTCEQHISQMYSFGNGEMNMRTDW